MTVAFPLVIVSPSGRLTREEVSLVVLSLVVLDLGGGFGLVLPFLVALMDNLKLEVEEVSESETDPPDWQARSWNKSLQHASVLRERRK